MEEKVYIERKDGIKYYRNAKTNNYDTKINVRVSKEMLEKLKVIAQKKEIGYNTLIRQIIENYVEQNKEV